MLGRSRTGTMCTSRRRSSSRCAVPSRDGYFGYLDDNLAQARDWGFRVADIRVPVVVRHGELDRLVPFAERPLARAMPSRRARRRSSPTPATAPIALPWADVVASSSRRPPSLINSNRSRGQSRLTLSGACATLRRPWRGNRIASRWATSPDACRQDRQPEEVNPGLAEVRVGENETFESALRRFNKKIQQSGILAEARRREHYEKPSVKRKRKEAKRKKNARTPQG